MIFRDYLLLSLFWQALLSTVYYGAYPESKEVLHPIFELLERSSALFTQLPEMATDRLSRSSRSAPSSIERILQNAPLDHYLSTEVLAELLELSKDAPQLTEEYPVQKYQEKLSCFPCFSSVQLSLIDPHTLYIDYQLHTPWFRIENYPNTLLLDNGALSPQNPLYRGEHLPLLRLSQEATATIKQWGDKISLCWQERIATIEKQLAKHPLPARVVRIDLSAIDHPHPKKREIILSLQQQEQLLFIRLPSTTIESTLEYLQTFLERKNSTLPLWIDARVEGNLLTK